MLGAVGALEPPLRAVACDARIDRARDGDHDNVIVRAELAR